MDDNCFTEILPAIITAFLIQINPKKDATAILESKNHANFNQTYFPLNINLLS